MNLIDDMITFQDFYAGVTDQHGRFMVSVYATVLGVTQVEITSVMPQKTRRGLACRWGSGRGLTEASAPGES